MSLNKHNLWFAVLNKEREHEGWRLTRFITEGLLDLFQKDPNYIVLSSEAPKFSFKQTVYLPSRFWYSKTEIYEVEPLVCKVEGQLKVTRLGYWIPERGGISEPDIDFFTSRLKAIKRAWEYNLNDWLYLLKEQLKGNDDE